MVEVQALRPAHQPGPGATRTTHRRRLEDYGSSDRFDRKLDGDQLRRLAERTRGEGGSAVEIPATEFTALGRLAQGTCGIYGFISPLDSAYIEVRAYAVRRFPWSKIRVAWQIAVMDSERARSHFSQLHLDDVRRMSW